MYLQFWTFFVLLTFCCNIYGFKIEEPQNYGPQTVPTDIPKARQALGYDKYERQTVASSQKTGRKFYPYGNNWEDFDVPPINYNFRYK